MRAVEKRLQVLEQTATACRVGRIFRVIVPQGETPGETEASINRAAIEAAAATGVRLSDDDVVIARVIVSGPEKTRAETQ